MTWHCEDQLCVCMNQGVCTVYGQWKVVCACIVSLCVSMRVCPFMCLGLYIPLSAHISVCVLRCRWMLILLEAVVRQNKAQLRCPGGHVELAIIAWWKSLCVISTVTSIQFALSQGAQVGHSADTGQSQDMKDELFLLLTSTQLLLTAPGLVLCNWPWPLISL